MAGKVVKSDAEWRSELTPEQYEVCRRKGTERAFTGRYYATKTDGIYRCSCCGHELFDSSAKYDSGTGWPSFHSPLSPESVHTESDRSHGMLRVEVQPGTCAIIT